jgi:predicted RNase H-like HicB family nuclease
MTAYIGIVHHEAGSAWGITFPDLAGCISAADRFEDLPAQAEEAVALWLETAIEAGQAVPAPRDLAAIRRHVDAKGAVSFLPITAPLTDHCIRLNITLPESLVQRIDAQVGSRQRSGFLARAARLALA